MSNNSDNQNEVICDCSGTTKAKIISLIEQGADDIDKIASVTGATTGCASCDYLVIELLVEFNALAESSNI